MRFRCMFFGSLFVLLLWFPLAVMANEPLATQNLQSAISGLRSLGNIQDETGANKAAAAHPVKEEKTAVSDPVEGSKAPEVVSELPAMPSMMFKAEEMKYLETALRALKTHVAIEVLMPEFFPSHKGVSIESEPSQGSDLKPAEIRAVVSRQQAPVFFLRSILYF